MVGTLADFVRVASGIHPRPPVGDGVLTRAPDGPLWGEPHDLRFDFDATREGSEWIDALAREAREELADTELDDMVAQARGRYFAADERRVLDAANLLLCAYGARCEHSDRRLHPELAGPPDRGWGALLEARGLGALR